MRVSPYPGGVGAPDRRGSRLRRLSREPLLHFFLCAAVLFAVQRVLESEPANRIVVPAQVVQALREEHVRRTGVPPTAREESALVQRFVDDELLYREAVKLGLDSGDLIIRRRLVQKLEFLNERLEPLPEPSEGMLRAYLEEHRDRYRVAARVTLTHVFADATRRGAEAERTAAQWREQLAAGASELGDPFLHGSSLPRKTQGELENLLGPEFAGRVMSLPLQQWSGPLRSTYGWHIVRVSERAPERHPELEEVRQAVERDWIAEQRHAFRRALLDRLRQEYEVVMAEVPSDGGMTASR